MALPCRTGQRRG